MDKLVSIVIPVYGVEKFIEVGPGKTLSGFVKRTMYPKKLVQKEQNEKKEEKLCQLH